MLPALLICKLCRHCLSLKIHVLGSSDKYTQTHSPSQAESVNHSVCSFVILDFSCRHMFQAFSDLKVMLGELQAALIDCLETECGDTATENVDTGPGSCSEMKYGEVGLNVKALDRTRQHYF